MSGEDKVMVTVSNCSKLGSVMTTEAKGWYDVAASVVACALLAPLTTGAVPTAEAMTELTAFVIDFEAVSVSTMVNVVVTVAPGETW